jgi:tetratricopeptide (TPR) repeat protein
VTDEKIQRWKTFVAGDPDNPLHNFALAGAYLQAGDFENGATAYARCLELDAQWMVAAIKRARCLVELERWDEAREALELGARLAHEQDHEEPFEEIRELRDQIPGS